MDVHGVLLRTALQGVWLCLTVSGTRLRSYDNPTSNALGMSEHGLYHSCEEI